MTMAVKTIILQRLSLRRLNHFVKSESTMLRLRLLCWVIFFFKSPFAGVSQPDLSIIS